MTFFGDIYRDKPVLVTGHTGFKGSWLTLWLKILGARVIGYALPPETTPNHFELLQNQNPPLIDEDLSNLHDLRDAAFLNAVVARHQPAIVFHLAAQPLVRRSYHQPLETFSTNVQGTVNVLEACRQCEAVKAIIHIGTDKCYENREWVWGYRERDALGGHDPYSASKACAELVGQSYRVSFFNRASGPLLASARAGNVIGGGDWAEDRLIPDMMRSANKKTRVLIRNPNSVRPWQHVLEPLSGYLQLGQRLLEGKAEFAEAWNFGPTVENALPVLDVLLLAQKHWPVMKYEIQTAPGDLKEAHQLRLDWTKARLQLNWQPVWSLEQAVENTVDWYRGFYESNIVLTASQLKTYTDEAARQQRDWIKL